MEEITKVRQAAYNLVHNYRDPATGRKGPGALASRVRMTESTLQNKVSRTDLSRGLFADEVVAITLGSNDYQLIDAINHEVGRASVPLPEIEFPADMDMMNAWAEWHAEIAETVAWIKKAYSDDKITTAECDRAVLELTEDFEKGLAMVGVMRGQAEPDEKVVQMRQEK